jgi:putative addiction module killer protein
MEYNEYIVYNTLEYDKWLNNQPAKSQLQILERISHIEKEGHFGDHKQVKDDVWELKWKNGRRVYYAYIPEQKILLLLGGNKNGQNKDIRQAEKIFQKTTAFKK